MFDYIKIALSEIITVFTTTHMDLNARSGFEPDNPLRIIPGIIERVVSSMINNDMANLLHFNGHILRHLSGSKYKGNNIVEVEISSAIGHITYTCLNNERIVDLCNFSANFIMCADENDGIETILWGAQELIKQLTKQPSKEDVSYVFLHVVEDLHYLFIDTDAKNSPAAERIVSFLERQNSLIAICEECNMNGIKKEIMNIRNYLSKKDI